MVNQVFIDETFDSEVTDYALGFEMISKSAIALTKTLLYQIDGMDFDAALETGMDVNVIGRMTEDSKKGIASFLKRE